MNNEESLRQFVAARLTKFHEAREMNIANTDARKLLARKNPYLYRYLRFDTTKEMVDALMAASLSSSEETTFGKALEDIAIHICEQAFGGDKSPAEGIDLQFHRDSKRYLVSIKSGPNWGNADQTKKMRQNFDSARGRLRQNQSVGEIVAVNGCCYGSTARNGGYHQMGDYYKLCGKEFWELISGEPEMYRLLFDMVAEAADARTQDDDVVHLSPAIKKATQAIRSGYSLPDGTLNWHAVLEELHSQR